MPSALRSLSFLAILAVSAPGVFTQDLANIPPCALSCSQTALASINNACSMTDFGCLCKNTEFVKASGECYKSNCAADQLPKAIEFGAKTCAQVGVTLPMADAAKAVSNAANATSKVASNVASAAGNHSTAASNTTAAHTGSTANSPAITNSSSSTPESSSAASTQALGFFTAATAVCSMIVLS